MKIHTINDLNNAVDMLCRVLETRLTKWDAKDKTWYEEHPFTISEGVTIKAKLLELIAMYPSEAEQLEVKQPTRRKPTKRLLK